MEYKANDLVYFEISRHKGVGKIVEVDNRVMPYLVYSTNIVNGHNGEDTGFKQDNGNNWWFKEEELKPFKKQVGQKYVVLEDYGVFNEGEIVTLIEIHEDNISLYKRFNDYDYLLDIDHVECQVRFYEDAEEE